MIEQSQAHSFLDERFFYEVKDQKKFNEEFSKNLNKIKEELYKMYFWALFDESDDIEIAFDSTERQILGTISYLQTSGGSKYQGEIDMLQTWLGITRMFDYLEELTENNLVTSQHVTAFIVFWRISTPR